MAAGSSASGGVGFLGLLTLLLVGLKATGYIGCSWWWVFAPMWIPTALLVLTVLVVLLISVIIAAVTD